ncbi:hypothetical protein B0H19DRAFT_1065398 [Mycena capillaripes]|nr:hypothetical protein B0H19DRAFT_1065398 [Mycena capillaripes]
MAGGSVYSYISYNENRVLLKARTRASPRLALYCAIIIAGARVGPRPIERQDKDVNGEARTRTRHQHGMSGDRRGARKKGCRRSAPTACDSKGSRAASIVSRVEDAMRGRASVWDALEDIRMISRSKDGEMTCMGRALRRGTEEHTWCADAKVAGDMLKEWMWTRVRRWRANEKCGVDGREARCRFGRPSFQAHASLCGDRYLYISERDAESILDGALALALFGVVVVPPAVPVKCQWKKDSDDEEAE